DGDRLIFRYDGIDNVVRQTYVTFAPGPSQRSAGQATFQLNLGPHSSSTLQLRVAVALSNRPRNEARRDSGLATLVETGRESYARWMNRQPAVETDNPVWNDLIERSRLDLHLLRSGTDDEPYPAT